MPVDSRWHLTDVQRFLVVLTVVTALFLGAMAWGMQSPILAVVALGLVLCAGLGVFLLGLRVNGRNTVQGTAYVLAVPPPPVGNIVGRCDLRLLVDLPGRPSTMVKLRDPSVPVIKWPQVGAVLPVEIMPHNAKQLRVRWELVDQRSTRVASPAEEAAAFAAPFFTEYADDAQPHSYAPADSSTANDAAPPVAARALDETFPPAPGSEADPEDLDDPYDLEALADIAELDRIETVDDFIGSADPAAEAQARAADFELPMRTIPQPRPADEPDLRPSTPAPAPPAPLTGEPDALAMGVMLVVSDLNRSVRFYRDLVGFEVVDSGANVAVLAYGEGRVLLRQLADMSPVERRVSHLHILVSDVDASYKDLKGRGVEFVHRPRVTSRGDRLDLWSATFRDPDGHDIALTQWRAREDAPPRAEH